MILPSITKYVGGQSKFSDSADDDVGNHHAVAANALKPFRPER